jgi:hypothetical protein
VLFGNNPCKQQPASRSEWAAANPTNISQVRLQNLSVFYIFDTLPALKHSILSPKNSQFIILFSFTKNVLGAVSDFSEKDCFLDRDSFRCLGFQKKPVFQQSSAIRILI